MAFLVRILCIATTIVSFFFFFIGDEDRVLPFVIVGDEALAFPLRENMMRPYPGRNLPSNYMFKVYINM